MILHDVKHLGTERVIGCWELDGILIDPGPESSLGNWIDALNEPPRAVLLTHIHLDHAGATGALVRRWPGLPVYVHERGAPHLVDPSKLLASAGRLYGDDMERLWGDVVPVPEANVTALSGGEEVLGFHVSHTPGHASHHVSYFDGDSGRAFVGDTACVRIPPSAFVMPPTPPPDIDLELWLSSLEAIESWNPDSLGLTHFDAIDDVPAHMETVRERLTEQAGRARRMDAEEFERALRADVDSEAMLQAVPPEQQWAGLRRYWDKRAERAEAEG